NPTMPAPITPTRFVPLSDAIALPAIALPSGGGRCPQIVNGPSLKVSVPIPPPHLAIRTSRISL
ncbi:MAG: hypothetical protein ACREE9_12050, partial [Stellaceae bacterium]